MAFISTHPSPNDALPTARSLFVAPRPMMRHMSAMQLDGPSNNRRNSGPAPTKAAVRRVTAKDAYAKWQAEPDKIKIIDVRTPEEFLFVGHPPMAWKIPLVAQSYLWDAEKGQFPMTPLPGFISRVRQVAKPEATL